MHRVLIGRIDKQLLRFPLFKRRLTIGRTKSNDIKLSAASISRRHAAILTDDEVTRIVDRNSSNGVYVNSRRVAEHVLQRGDRIRIGTAARVRYRVIPTNSFPPTIHLRGAGR